MDHLHHSGMPVNQDLGDLRTSSGHRGTTLLGTNHDASHRDERLLMAGHDGMTAGQLHNRGIGHPEALDASGDAWDRRAPGAAATPGDIGSEVLGTKVALDVLFPNLDRDDEPSMASNFALDRRQPGAAAARLPASSPDDFSRGWAGNNHRFEHRQGMPPSFPRRRSPERPQHDSPGPLGEDCYASDIVESVAAMALGFDMEDESPHDRPLDRRRANRNDLALSEPATASQALAFSPPPATSAGHAGVSLHDVLPMQDSLWQPPPRIPAAKAAKLQSPAPGTQLGQCRQPSGETTSASSTGARSRLLPPPPPSEPPPPPPAQFMSRPLQYDQAVALPSS